MNSSDQTIRKAAIVISSLDVDTADRLLEQMPDEMAAKVRYQVLSLDDISETERQLVLNEFMGKPASSQESDSEGVELNLSSQSREVTSQASTLNQPPSQQVAPPFQYLHDAPVEMLAPFFEQENPQMTAVVLSHLTAERAAEILQQLPTSLQADVIHRIVELRDTDPEIIAQLELRLHDLIQYQMRTFERRKVGLSAAQSILNASDKQDAALLLSELKSRGSSVPQSLGQSPGQRRVAQQDTALAGYQQQAVGNRLQPMKNQAEVKPKKTIRKITKEINSSTMRFNEFETLSDSVLGSVLQAAAPQTVLLALAGASATVKKRICRGLTTKETQLLDKRIRAMQPVLLSDIDRAQTMLCVLAEKAISPEAHTNSTLMMTA
ncbi:MAG: FliG C-terminal domain-containing protein [Pirellulales bacterium]|jgi:flagellar motor switch protein FliG